MTTSELFGREKVSRLLFRLAPPVMFAQLIQALYNIVDSFFIGRNGLTGLTALSIIYPFQLLMIALAVGTGGVEKKKAKSLPKSPSLLPLFSGFCARFWDFYSCPLMPDFSLIRPG